MPNLKKEMNDDYKLLELLRKKHEFLRVIYYGEGITDFISIYDHQIETLENKIRLNKLKKIKNKLGNANKIQP